MNDDDKDIALFAGLITLVLLLCICGVAAYRHTKQATVTGFHWERSVQIMRWQTITESDWSIPAGGRYVRQYQAIHHYDQVKTGSHEECAETKNDVCTRQRRVDDYDSVPVYMTKYDYEIERWMYNRTKTLTGNDKAPKWPDVSDLRTHPIVQIGDEQAGMYISRYTVAFETGKDSYTLDIDEGQWAAFSVNDPCDVTFNLFGQPMTIKPGKWR